MARRTASQLKDPVKLEHPIVIDSERDWVFSNEDEVVHFFKPTIEKLHEEFAGLHQEEDFDLHRFPHSDKYLEETLRLPDEIWQDKESHPAVPVHIFIRGFEEKGEKLWYIVMVYMSQGRATFVFTHFPTRIEEMASTYRRTQMIYGAGVVDVEFVDALSTEDEFATRLFSALMKMRSDTDIPEGDFNDYQEFRAETLDSPDEIWRSEDGGEVPLVRFIKEFRKDEDNSFFYIVVMGEESGSHSHYVLFSFPTADRESLDRYRQGESLDPAEFVREESH